MGMPAPVPNRSHIALRGAVAGAAGGLLLGAAIAGSGFRTTAHISALELTVIFGAACVAWGIGYASLAATQPQIDRFPALSGLTFGAIAYVVTQIVLYGIAAEQTHTVQQVIFGLAATCVLFGLPVAYVTRALGAPR